MSNQYAELLKGAQRFLLHMSDPIYIIGLDDQIIWVNRAFEAVFGFTAEYLNRNGLAFYPEYTFVEIEQYKNQLKHQDMVNVYSSRHCQDGTRLYVNISMMPIHNEQWEAEAYTVILKETVSEEDLKRQSDKRHQIIAENIADTIVLVDNDSVVRYVSPSIRQLTGYEVDDYEGFDAFGLIHPDDRERVQMSHSEAVQTGEKIELEYRIIHKNGDIKEVEARVVPVADKLGRMEYVVAVARDITKRKTTEKLLQRILDNVNAAVWSSNKQFSRLNLCSDSIEKFFKLPRSVIEANPLRMHDHIHPEDAAALSNEIRSQLSEGIPMTKAVRLLVPDTELKWIKIIAMPVLDNNGAIERIDGIFLDITEQQRAELALEESEQRYKSLFENNLDGVFSIQLNGSMVNANKSFENVAGTGLQQLYDRMFISLVIAEDRDKVASVIAEVIRTEQPADIECAIRTNEAIDKERIVSVTYVPIFLAGRMNGVHGIVKDITERKRDERLLIQSEEKSNFMRQSLNRLSGDLANVMKVTQLEQRLIDEVEEVLQVSHVTIEEDPNSNATADGGEIRLKISEREHPVYLKFRQNRPLLKIEEEWLNTAIRYVTILYDNLHLIQDLMLRLETMVAGRETPKWMLRLLFKLSEKERASLSSDLHDSVLQDLIIWYRKLESLHSRNIFDSGIQSELVRIEEGLLDAIHQIRITCNELRPPFLLKMGLVQSLKSLFAYTGMFSNYEIRFEANQDEAALGEEQIIGLYRIVQELLNNATKHSNAATVEMELTEQLDGLCFTYSDDGVGMDMSTYENSFQHMGISGIEKRVLSLDGEMSIRTALKEGFHVRICIPKLMP